MTLAKDSQQMNKWNVLSYVLATFSWSYVCFTKTFNVNIGPSGNYSGFMFHYSELYNWNGWRFFLNPRIIVTSDMKNSW